MIARVKARNLRKIEVQNVKDNRLEILNNTRAKINGVCPYLKTDKGIYCGKDYNGEEVSRERRVACRELPMEYLCCANYKSCMFFTGEGKF